MPDIDWFSFIVGFISATILLAFLAQVAAWLRRAFQPAGGKPLMQRAAETVRNLIMALLALLVMGMAVYIAYSILFKPMP
jgi:Zn-dependent protease